MNYIKKKPLKKYVFFFLNQYFKMGTGEGNCTHWFPSFAFASASKGEICGFIGNGQGHACN